MRRECPETSKPLAAPLTSLHLYDVALDNAVDVLVIDCSIFKLLVIDGAKDGLELFRF